IQPYRPDAALVQAVNLSILLRRPLLVMGAPGCGKSKLAQAVAYELYHGREKGGEPQNYRDWYREWHIKSSSKAKDGLYEFDAIRRLADAQALSMLASHKGSAPPTLEEAKKEMEKNLSKKDYVELRELGQAIEKTESAQWRAVLLIDEIDKADIDFPNDLLNELDKSEFKITETGETVSSAVPPIVIITSNAEKPLPDAFLRRCLFHFIKPLDRGILKEIIERRFYSTGSERDDELVDRALNQFLQVRKELEDNKVTLGKGVSTSELLDWFEAVKFYSEKKSDEEKSQLLESMIADLEKLGKGAREVPFHQALFKNKNTLFNFAVSSDQEDGQK
ncbi:MAG: MoxR family ATPase, partial [Phaeodactylibacter sp.]|nr:MoxR family ATPase [Phaeodactylibacter sp.]